MHQRKRTTSEDKDDFVTGRMTLHRWRWGYNSSGGGVIVISSINIFENFVQLLSHPRMHSVSEDFLNFITNSFNTCSNGQSIIDSTRSNRSTQVTNPRLDQSVLIFQGLIRPIQKLRHLFRVAVNLGHMGGPEFNPGQTEFHQGH